MNEFRFSCPRCGQKFQGDERWAGKQMLCTACNHLIVVPRRSNLPVPAGIVSDEEEMTSDLAMGTKRKN